MAKTKAPQGPIYVAKESFAIGDISVVGEVTTVREGHPLLIGREHLFRPIIPDYEVEQPA